MESLLRLISLGYLLHACILCLEIWYGDYLNTINYFLMTSLFLTKFTKIFVQLIFFVNTYLLS